MSFDIVNGGEYEIAVNGRYQGQSIVNVHNFRSITSGVTVFPVIGGATAALTEFRTLWRANFLPIIATGYSVDSYQMKRIDETLPRPTNKYAYDATFQLIGDPLNDVSAGGAAGLPTFVAVNVRLQTSAIGRNYRGRKAYGPVPEGDTDNAAGSANILTIGGRNTWLNAAAFLYPNFTVGAGATGFTLQGVVASSQRYRGQFVTWTTTVQAIDAPFVLGSQLSRKQLVHGA